MKLSFFFANASKFIIKKLILPTLLYILKIFDQDNTVLGSKCCKVRSETYSNTNKEISFKIELLLVPPLLMVEREIHPKKYSCFEFISGTQTDRNLVQIILKIVYVTVLKKRMIMLLIVRSC